LIITNHGYLEDSFASAPHDEIWAGVGRHMQILGDAGFKVFLNSGTLLGLTRDGKLIEHDNDIDLAIILQAESEDEAIIEWKNLPEKLTKLGIFLEGSQDYNGFMRLKPVAGFDVDIFPGWFSKDKVFVYPHTFGELTPAEVYPFKTCKITGLNLPSEPEKMLEINYGPGWKVPDQLFKFRKPNYFKKFLEYTKEPEPRNRAKATRRTIWPAISIWNIVKGLFAYSAFNVDCDAWAHCRTKNDLFHVSAFGTCWTGFGNRVAE
jgi:hypothetical protein